MMCEVNCMNCHVGAFKHGLCPDDFCEKFKALGTEDDFIKMMQCKTGKWIPCSERLPEDKTAYYLATIANRGLFFTTTLNNNVECVRWDYDRRKGRDSWHWCTERTVIAWMQLPEPWKEGEK